jgi:hypothetical protein
MELEQSHAGLVRAGVEAKRLRMTLQRSSGISTGLLHDRGKDAAFRGGLSMLREGRGPNREAASEHAPNEIGPVPLDIRAGVRVQRTEAGVDFAPKLSWPRRRDDRGRPHLQQVPVVGVHRRPRCKVPGALFVEQQMSGDVGTRVNPERGEFARVGGEVGLGGVLRVEGTRGGGEEYTPSSGPIDAHMGVHVERGRDESLKQRQVHEAETHPLHEDAVVGEVVANELEELARVQV